MNGTRGKGRYVAGGGGGGGGHLSGSWTPLLLPSFPVQPTRPQAATALMRCASARASSPPPPQSRACVQRPAPSVARSQTPQYRAKGKERLRRGREPRVPDGPGAAGAGATCCSFVKGARLPDAAPPCESWPNEGTETRQGALLWNKLLTAGRTKNEAACCLQIEVYVRIMSRESTANRSSNVSSCSFASDSISMNSSSAK